ncbi:TIGR02594 family protein [Tenacibaculum sp. MAR_2009_124]|uniref:TIGR02594 family protein n=1 Tax=Tenacibaculum sp. MAR_2009_124 TaxID=1250059 RepID=UPI00089BD16D|nr:TIGR02594 family protein [Tenacibaculum sp. MAR_2009_124]SED10733.1 TIGR02594 family protein [Tenacibaculum sp. MAR_2009_124]
MNRAIEIGLSQIGIKEIRGRKDNPEVIKYFTEIGFDGGKFKDETAWCSAFVNWCCKKAGLEISGKLTARSWLKMGESVHSAPRLGDIVVLWREDIESWKGHVGFFVRKDKNWIWILGGNQNNEVKIKAYPQSRLLDFRRL